LDLPYNIKLVFVQKITFVFRKSTKTAATRAALFDFNMHQIVCRLGLLKGGEGVRPLPQEEKKKSRRLHARY